MCNVQNKFGQVFAAAKVEIVGVGKQMLLIKEKLHLIICISFLLFLHSQMLTYP